MINVSNATKNAYKVSSEKTLKVYFPSIDETIPSSKIVEESFSLKELLESSSYLTFTGCICSQMELAFVGVRDNFKGLKIEVSIQAGETDEIPLFNGIVDSQKITDYDEGKCKITAYDELYTKGQTDIASWYKNIEFPITLKQYRESLFTFLDLDYVSTNLANDSIEIEKQYSPAAMKALDSIRAICQINGVFGIINRDGFFEFRSIEPIDVLESYDEVAFYKNIDYERYTVKPIGKVTVRQNTNDDGATYGSGGNTYIVQANMFTLNLEPEVIETIAHNLYDVVNGITYIPYTAESYAMPWVEVGDIIKYQIYDYKTDTYTPTCMFVFERNTKGIQAIMDTFKAGGEEFQSVFISDLHVQISTIQNQIESLQGKLNSLQLNYIMFYNESAVDVEDGETKPIANIQFAVAKEGQVRIDLEYLIECETTEEETSAYITNNDLEVTLFYEYDGNIIDSREPQETYQDGRHILSTFYILNVDNTTMHSWKVWLECMGGSIHIDLLKAQNTILGIGISGREDWGGLIEITDRMSPISIVETLVAELTDTAIVTLLDPVRISPIETMNPQDIDPISVATLTDTCGVDPVVTNAWVDETTKNQMTYNHTFVVVDNHNFVLATEFTSVSTSQVIDSGYCTKVTPTTNGLATITSVEVVCNS